MADGFSQANFLHAILNHWRGGTSWTAPTALYAKLHTAAPGAAFTTSPSVVTTRAAIAYAAAASNAIAQTGTAPSFTGAGISTTETVTDVSVWDNLTAGNAQYSAPLTASKTWANGDIINLSTYSLGAGPQAS